jgi:hypothetical protein
VSRASGVDLASIDNYTVLWPWTRETVPVIKRWMTILSLSFLVACAARPAALPQPRDALPASDTIPGWQQEGESTTYDRESLSDLLGDQVDLYMSYGFEELAVGQYTNANGSTVQVKVYRLATDADAYGLFARHSHGDSIDLGVDGAVATGYRLAFWQSRTFVQIVAQSQLDDPTLVAFGQAVSSALPEGGQRPSLVEALPTEGMQQGKARFFRDRTALGSLFGTGLGDPLGLDAESKGALAHYEIGGREFDLMLIAYPDAARAQTAQTGLKGAGIQDLVITHVKERTLGAVFGQLNEDQDTKPGCDCAADEPTLAFGRLPEETAAELLDQAMAALP